ncbi:hypothetical protein [Sphingopyxis witflariensis]|uniref:Uncharacterized protein n=1 Tax=Sphingopyxis witflariensis TaxID=173675 RepID=A0A246JYC2_9SPHN|nr:hypothetical protein [Sphingopyxis witflariensis]OWQ98007.1 hypothetical protein CDQ91_10330 [Sphingopyxis witflariensis]
MVSRPGIGGPTITAHLICSGCRKSGQLGLRVNMPPEAIDKKFKQSGWRLDPHVCPDCIRKPSKGNIMASEPSTAAVKSQAKMFTLLSQHFDAETGHYAKGWSDKKVADESGASPAMVSAVRAEAFGELKEPSEISALRSDISTLESLMVEQIASLRTELAKVSKAYA